MSAPRWLPDADPRGYPADSRPLPVARKHGPVRRSYVVIYPHRARRMAEVRKRLGDSDYRVLRIKMDLVALQQSWRRLERVSEFARRGKCGVVPPVVPPVYVGGSDE